MPDDALTPAQADELMRVLRSFAGQVRRVELFGSRARGTHRPGSDIDLAVSGPIDAAGLRDLAAALDESDLSVTVDLHHRDRVADPALRAAIDRDAVVLADLA